MMFVQPVKFSENDKYVFNIPWLPDNRWGVGIDTSFPSGTSIYEEGTYHTKRLRFNELNHVNLIIMDNIVFDVSKRLAFFKNKKNPWVRYVYLNFSKKISNTKGVSSGRVDSPDSFLSMLETRKEEDEALGSSFNVRRPVVISLCVKNSEVEQLVRPGGVIERTLNIAQKMNWYIFFICETSPIVLDSVSQGHSCDVFIAGKVAYGLLRKRSPLKVLSATRSTSGVVILSGSQICQPFRAMGLDKRWIPDYYINPETLKTVRLPNLRPPKKEKKKSLIMSRADERLAYTNFLKELNNGL